MLTDPRYGLWASLVVAALSALWLLAQWPFGDALFAILDYAVFAADFLAIFLVIAGVAVALLFLGYARVRRDLLANRNVVARWRVEPEMFARFAVVADARDESDKRGALLLVSGFVVVIFGAFAIADPEVAAPMTGIGAAVIAIVFVAYVLGGRVRRKQLQPRSGEVIVGRDGVLVNDVLHVWRTPLSWFSGARIQSGSPAMLILSYTYLARYGSQTVAVMAPVPPDSIDLARHVVETLEARRRRPTPGRLGAQGAGR